VSEAASEPAAPAPPESAPPRRSGRERKWAPGCARWPGPSKSP